MRGVKGTGRGTPHSEPASPILYSTSRVPLTPATSEPCAVYTLKAAATLPHQALPFNEDWSKVNLQNARRAKAASYRHQGNFGPLVCAITAARYSAANRSSPSAGHRFDL